MLCRRLKSFSPKLIRWDFNANKIDAQCPQGHISVCASIKFNNELFHYVVSVCVRAVFGNIRSISFYLTSDDKYKWARMVVGVMEKLGILFMKQSNAKPPKTIISDGNNHDKALCASVWVLRIYLYLTLLSRISSALVSFYGGSGLAHLCTMRAFCDIGSNAKKPIPKSQPPGATQREREPIIF